MGIQGVVVEKIGDYKSSLKVSTDVRKDLKQVAPPERATHDLVKVRVISCGVCFPDVLTIEGRHAIQKSPLYVPCNEIAGEVIEIGPEVKDLQVGDKIFGTTSFGGLQSETYISERGCYKIPEGINPDLVAGFEVNYGTTYHALVDLAKVKSGETLLVLGASGGVGMSAIDLGKALGCKVVACASTDEKLEACRNAGADIVINYVNGKGGDFKKALKDAGVYGSVDVVYDPVGGSFSEVALRATGWGGRFIVIGFAAGGANPKSAIPSVPLNLALLNERHIIGCFWGPWVMRTGNEINAKNIEHMLQLIKQGKMKPLVSKIYSLTDYEKAFDSLMNRQVIGKVIVKPSSSSSSKL